MEFQSPSPRTSRFLHLVADNLFVACEESTTTETDSEKLQQFPHGWSLLPGKGQEETNYATENVVVQDLLLQSSEETVQRLLRSLHFSLACAVTHDRPVGRFGQRFGSSA